MKRRTFLFVAILMGMVFFGGLPAVGGEIVAIVNDEPISSFDVEARAKLIAVQRAEYLSNQRKAQYVKEALNDIVDDKIKMSEAKRYHFSVRESDIDDAIHHLEAQNNIKRGEMAKMLEKNGIPIRILREQIRADLMWVQVLQRQQAVVGEITPAEIKQKKNELRAKLREEEFFVFEILVPTKELAEKCYHLLHQGVPFDEVAQKYSKAASARNGGEAGWIKNNYYTKTVTEVLRHLSQGELSVPLKTNQGYLIVLLQDKKVPILKDTVPVWELAQMAMPTKTAVQFEKQLTDLKTCESFMAFAHKYGVPETVKSGSVSPDQLPEELRDILIKQPVKVAVGPVRAQDLDIFFMKCAVTEKNVLPSDEIIKTQIENEKMEAVSAKLLKNAKRYAVVEYK